MANYDLLEAIGLSDPDGQPTRPTEADYERFKQWVIREHGLAVWIQLQAD